VSQHLDLVQKMVSQITTRVPSHVRRDDLVSAGMAGLVLAARHFDPARHRRLRASHSWRQHQSTQHQST